MTLLDLLATRHEDWLRMARSFGADYDTSHDLVQEMYLRLYRYVGTPEKIMYGNEVNTFFVFVTLRNMYFTLQKERAKVTYVPIDDFDAHEEIYNIDSDESLDLLLDSVNQEVQNWHWYDNKIFELYHNSDMSMRQLATETKISLRSIYNTLKNAKERIRTNCQTDFESWQTEKRVGRHD